VSPARRSGNPARKDRPALLRNSLIVALVLALGFLTALQVPRFGGRYLLRERDHSAVMTSGVTPSTRRTVAVLFVGNSLTFSNDMPAMLVNIAASDPGNTTQLAVKAFTYPGASLDYMLTQSQALAWVQANHVDYVVLQERSGWYGHPVWIEQATNNARAWRDALQPLNETPILFESWADKDGSQEYTDSRYFAFGRNFKDVNSDAERSTAILAQQLGMRVVKVARAFYFAAAAAGAPDLYRSDRHHPSRAGSFLAALAFYRHFTGRSGAEATYRPFGVSAAEAAVLIEAAGR
jgi:hypothetical protein